MVMLCQLMSILLYYIVCYMGNCVMGETQQRNHNYASRSLPASNTRNPSNTANNKQQGTKSDTAVRVDLHKMNNLNPLLRPVLPKQLVDPKSNPHLADKITLIPNQHIEIKAPKDFASWTEFAWIKQPKYQIPAEIAKEHSSFIHSRSFQQKYAWFRENLEKQRIHWSAGKSEYLHVDRANLLMSSHAQFQAINFHKEVKIVFGDEKEASDAGGLLREWMNMCIDEIFSPQLHLLSLCDSNSTYYKFNFNEHVQELFEVAAKILGIVIGKAIFQRIPLKCFLNYTVWRQICCQPVQMNDVYTYDRDFYRGWKFMIQNYQITALQNNFCVYEFDEHGTQITIPLKQNGFHLMVNSTNREEYVTLVSKHYCTNSVIKMIEHIRYGVYKIIPPDLLSVFEPHELDMIINGKKDIDLQDLKDNIKYTDCKPNDQVIQWFWSYVETLSAEQLENMLHFVTGNGRVPILGFKYLESNRGEYQKFEIKQVAFNELQQYPKSHTCFNRLQLPLYPSKQVFDRNIVYIAVENKYFGLQ